MIVPVIYSDCRNKIDLILMTPTSDESNIATLACPRGLRSALAGAGHYIRSGGWAGYCRLNRTALGFSTCQKRTKAGHISYIDADKKSTVALGACWCAEFSRSGIHRTYHAVVDAWKAYLTNLGKELPATEQRDRYEVAIKERDFLLTKLIAEIANVLGIEVTQLDILEGNYVPQGWEDAEWEQQLVRRGLLDVLYGRASIPVTPHVVQQEQNPYPPPPSG